MRLDQAKAAKPQTPRLLPVDGACAKKICAVTWRAILLPLLFSSHLLAQQTRPNPPRVFLINAQKLAETKRRIQSGDKTLDAALAKLEADARQALQQEPVSVVTKPLPFFL